jgi:hypothetical protein
MRINVKCSSGHSNEVAITTEKGEVLDNVKSLDIRMRFGEPVVAELAFLVPGIETMLCEATVSEAHLHELAEAHGFELIARKAS